MIQRVTHEEMRGTYLEFPHGADRSEAVIASGVAGASMPGRGRRPPRWGTGAGPFSTSWVVCATASVAPVFGWLGWDRCHLSRGRAPRRRTSTVPIVPSRWGAGLRGRRRHRGRPSGRVAYRLDHLPDRGDDDVRVLRLDVVSAVGDDDQTSIRHESGEKRRVRL